MIGSEVTIEGKIYKLETNLGHGSFGDVYLAVHHPTMEYIAVKILRNKSAIALKALRNEIELAGKIVHPNVVAVLGNNLDPNHPLGIYLALEYVSGGTLRKKLDDWKNNNQLIPLAQAGQIMLDIAQGTKAVNAHLLHRDLKPDNILFNGTRYKITDFGIAKIVSDATRDHDHTFKGMQHLRYMAPENWVGESNSEKLDVYSVGLIFFEILALRHPLESFVTDQNSERAWETAHIQRPCPNILDWRNDIDPKWAQLLLRMTAKSPEMRPTWDEVIAIIDGSEVIRERSFKLKGLIDAVTSSHNLRLDEVAKAAEQKRQAEFQQSLIKEAELKLAESLDEVIETFNENFPDGQFEIEKGVHLHAIRRFSKDHLAPYVLCMFDGPFLSPLHQTQEFALSAGYIGPEFMKDSELSSYMTQFSANLILVKGSADDMIGEWRFAYSKDDLTVIRLQGGSKTIQVSRGKTTSQALFPSPMMALNQLRLGESKLFFRTDIQQAFIDLLQESIQFSDGHRSKL